MKLEPRKAAQGKPMLSSFTIENFKSYREATLKLAPLTVLIGANASGKLAGYDRVP